MGKLKLPVKVWIDGIEAEIIYSGAAPQVVEGVFQINAKIPAGVRAGNLPLVVRIGNNPSQPVSPSL